MDRRGFAQCVLAGIVVSIKPACGSTPTAPDEAENEVGAISANHGHVAVITAAQLGGGIGLVLDDKHDHVVTFN